MVGVRHGRIGSMRRAGTRARHLAGTGLVVLLAVSAGACSHEPPRAAAAPPTTSTTTTTTTTTQVPVVADPWTTTIATAVGPELAIESTPPAGVSPSPIAVATRAANQASFASYSPERAGAPEIPSLQQPVAGRRRTPTGWVLENPASFDGPAVVVVTEDHGDWLRVLVPVRPNGSEGWVRRSDVTLSTTTLHVEVLVGERKVRLYDGDTVLLEAPVIVGKATSPTPLGRFYVTDVDAKYTGSAYGPWVLPVSGFSQALDTFGGGAPALALHGTNRPDLMGKAASNGCVRLPNDVITRLRETLPMGTPVDIRP